MGLEVDLSDHKMSEPQMDNIKNESIKCDKDKKCNKFSIESILGLNDDAKANRLELINIGQKGRVYPCPEPSEP